MQQQVLQDTDVRLTEEEASLIVALHSEQEQKLGVTTLRDLAETLRIPTSEAQLLLAQARTKLNPVQEVPRRAGKEIESTPKPRPRRRGWRLIAFLAYSAAITGIAS